MKHDSSGKCQKCAEIFDAYLGFHQELRSWFEGFQKIKPEAHISSAGRGLVDQESAFHKGASRAHFGQSAHNYNCAIDIFCLLEGSPTIYPVVWFQQDLAPLIPDFIEWYGHPQYRTMAGKFFELPHLEIRGWVKLKEQGLVKLVE